MAALIEELELGSAVVGGYDVGSGVAHALVRARLDLVRALVLAPPLPGTGGRELGPQGQREFWYQSFHRLPLADRLIDGDVEVVRACLEYLRQQWSGPGGAVDGGSDKFDRLVGCYAAPGAIWSSIAWYRAGPDAYDLGQPAHGRPEPVPTALTLLWPRRTRCSRRPGRPP